MFRRIGFFHLAVGHAQPLASLERCLPPKASGRTLVVLPEGFNIGRRYWDGTGSANYSRSVLSDLQRLALESNVTFVAGLILRACCVRRNSAFLIDAGKRVRITDKATNDGSGLYEPAVFGRDETTNPTELDNGLAIAVAICADLQESQGWTWRTGVAKRLREKSGTRVLAVPASGTQLFGGESLQPGEKMLSKTDFHEVAEYLVFANSHQDGRSFVAKAGIVCKVWPHKDDTPSDALRLVELPGGSD